MKPDMREFDALPRPIRDIANEYGLENVLMLYPLTTDAKEIEAYLKRTFDRLDPTRKAA